ncbi:MAG: hypothetical protein ABI867_16435 [Kofleriaceae bacterium]
MVADPSPVIACARQWRPNPGWVDVVREPRAALVAGARGLEASQAWSSIAMMMGDTGAAPLALIVCLHADADLPVGVEDRRLSAHRDLCLLDLGLANAPGPVAIAELGSPGVVTDRPADLAAWLARALIPFAGDLRRAAWYALELAAHRMGLVADEPAI